LKGHEDQSRSQQPNTQAQDFLKVKEGEPISAAFKNICRIDTTFTVHSKSVDACKHFKNVQITGKEHGIF